MQQPRIPIWVAGIWPHKKPFRRAARWDGAFPLLHDGPLPPDGIRAMLAYTRQYRTSSELFAVIAVGWAYEHGKEVGDALLADYADAGVTWWLEGFNLGDTTADVRPHPARTAAVLRSEALMIPGRAIIGASCSHH